MWITDPKAIPQSSDFKEEHLTKFSKGRYLEAVRSLTLGPPPVNVSAKGAQPPAIAVPEKNETANIAAQTAQSEVNKNTVSMAALYATAIKNELRDPSSLQWVGIWSNNAGTVFCFQYRARNGFGGMNLEHMAVAKGQTSRAENFWNKYCAGRKTNDITQETTQFIDYVGDRHLNALLNTLQ